LYGDKITSIDSLWLLFAKMKWGTHGLALQYISLSLVGIMLFVMIFEVRARYLYVYEPYFIIAGTIGIQNVYKKCIRKNPVYLEIVEFGGNNI